MSAPAPLTLNVADEYEAAPLTPTPPMSRVSHGAGNGACDVDTPAVVLADAVAPALSVTVRVTLKVPLVE